MESGQPKKAVITESGRSGSGRPGMWSIWDVESARKIATVRAGDPTQTRDGTIKSLESAQYGLKAAPPSELLYINWFV